MMDVDVQLAVADGERRFTLSVQFCAEAPVLALYGPSGAGKSMTLQAIAGLLRPAAGHVRIGGATWFDAAQGVNLPPERRSVGYLFQDYALFPHLSVARNVGFGLTPWWRLRPAPAVAQRVHELLAAFGLAGLAQARVGALSGGQRQRVALARALACEPALLLLDEPFAALNPMLRESLRDELAQVRARWQVPMVMITHDIDDVLALADQACVLAAGRVVREVDVRSGLSRERVAQGLDPDQLSASDPLHQARRRQLAAGLAGPGGG